MKKISIIIVIALFLTSCGDSNSAGPTSSDNLFLNPSNQLVQTDVSPSLLGLWESENYIINGVTFAIRWEVTLKGITLSKRCTDKSDKHFYAQVSIDYDTTTLTQLNAVTPSSIPIASSASKVSDLSVMTDYRPCRVAIDPASNSSNYLIASDTGQYDISDDSFESGQMLLSIEGQTNDVKFNKIQDR